MKPSPPRAPRPRFGRGLGIAARPRARGFPNKLARPGLRYVSFLRGPDLWLPSSPRWKCGAFLEVARAPEENLGGDEMELSVRSWQRVPDAQLATCFSHPARSYNCPPRTDLISAIPRNAAAGACKNGDTSDPEPPGPAYSYGPKDRPGPPKRG